MNINATIIGQTIAFILFVVLCMKYIWPPLIKSIERRQKEIIDGLTFSEQAKKELDLARSNSIAQLNDAKAEAKLIIDNANKHSLFILNKAENEIKQKFIKMKNRAKIEIEAERVQAFNELREQLATIVIAVLFHSLLYSV